MIVNVIWATCWRFKATHWSTLRSLQHHPEVRHLKQESLVRLIFKKITKKTKKNSSDIQYFHRGKNRTESRESHSFPLRLFLWLFFELLWRKRTHRYSITACVCVGVSRSVMCAGIAHLSGDLEWLRCRWLLWCPDKSTKANYQLNEWNEGKGFFLNSFIFFSSEKNLYEH